MYEQRFTSQKSSGEWKKGQGKVHLATSVKINFRDDGGLKKGQDIVLIRHFVFKRFSGNPLTG